MTTIQITSCQYENRGGYGFCIATATDGSLWEYELFECNYGDTFCESIQIRGTIRDELWRRYGVMRFREHHGAADDSAATTVELAQTMDALRTHLSSLPRGSGPTWAEDAAITVKHYMGPDFRIGWPQHYIVSIAGWGPVGFTDCMPT